MTALQCAAIPAHVVTNLSDALLLLKAENSENEQHKEFVPSEKVAMAARLEPMERAAAQARLAVTSENFSEVNESDKGNALGLTNFLKSFQEV